MQKLDVSYLKAMGHSHFLEEVSPMFWVDGSEPPFLLIHSSEDTLIPAWMAEDFAAALEETGVNVEIQILDASHGFITDASFRSDINEQSREITAAFLANVFEKR